MDIKARVSNEELLALTKRAFDNDEVAEFLCGEKGYACPLDRFVPANVPTDFGRIVNLGVCRLYTETQNEEFVEKFKKAVLFLLNGNAVQIWAAYFGKRLNLLFKKTRINCVYVKNGRVLIWKTVCGKILNVWIKT